MAGFVFWIFLIWMLLDSFFLFFSFLLSNVRSLTGFDVFLIFCFAVLISALAFFVFRWIYSGLISSQKELISTKQDLVDHYRDRCEDYKAELEKSGPAEGDVRVCGLAGESLSLSMAHYTVSLKLEAAFYILRMISMLKNQLWVEVVSSRSQAYVEEIKTFMYRIDEAVVSLEKEVAIISDSSDPRLFASHNDVRSAMHDSTSISFLEYKRLISDVESFLGVEDSCR